VAALSLFMPDEILFKDCALELKVATGDGPGTLEGYAAVFGNVDRDNEVIVPGAFSRTLDDFKSSGFLCNGHNWKEELGTIVDAKEDDRGLFIVAEFYSTPDAQQVRQRLAEKQARGRRQGMSIGYRVKQASKVNGVRHLTDLDLMEVSVVTVPANPQARVSAVKDFDPEAEARRMEMRRIYVRSLARQWAER
jgi:HK97 family phage prohead protease